MPKLGGVYARGDFFQQLAGAHKPSVDDMLSDRDYFGLDLSIIPLYGNIRTEDGQMYELLRNPGGNAIYSGLVIQDTTLDGKNLMFNADLTKDCATSEGSVGVREGNEAVWRSAPGIPGKAFEIRVSEDHTKWIEDGLFCLEGPMIKPGLHWYLPARDDGTYYVSHMLELSGEFQGVKARGFVAFDQVIWPKAAACIRTAMS